ncbi:type 2 DNA topoisomerase 6 subunit B-like isoform X3 [Cucurbita moschata]|uniref:Type 2 DNA topoisomerase 6 subunit B-like isoform X3 n=1 Tax=Cucurbita moschata TaxID=3662 RepID=A0A6J1HGR7_CUCMO|nr:type 2 DNA topoisomerase 6 subunit B-like isoform X3 [Cucurbita moschata]
MEFASLQDLCLLLISLAIRRCICSERLCRLSVLLQRSPASDPPLVRISISDTGLGSCIEEFQNLKCPVEDGIVYVRTTNICDKEISCYELNLKENVTTRKPILLPSNIKHGVKFSGTEVCLSVSESVDVLLEEFNCFFQKILVLKVPNIAMEVMADGQDVPGSRNDAVFLEKFSPSSSFAASTLDHLKLGLESYVLRHGSSLACDSCFPNRDNLRSGGGMVCEDKHKTTKLVVEAAVVTSEIPNPTNNCFGAGCSDTKVLCFKDFAPCSISEALLKALTGIDWKRYGLALECAIDQRSHALLKWEHMPLSFHIHIVVHCYDKLVFEAMPLLQKTRFDKKLIRKAVKLALDDFKNKHAGVLLSADTLKVLACSRRNQEQLPKLASIFHLQISKFAPDLAKSIAGLVLYSSDMDFKEECLAILGLQPHQSEGEIVGENIKKKIISAIEVNDRRQQGTREVAPLLFEGRHELQYVDDECDEDGFDPMDL